MGRTIKGTDEDQDVLAWLFDDYYRLSRKVPKHTFSIVNTATIRKIISKQDAYEEAESRGLIHTNILIARNTDMAKAHNESIGLRSAFPSAPHKHSIWGFYIKRSQSEFVSFQNFAANYSAKHFIDFMIGDKPFKWLSEETIITDDAIELRCEQGPAFQELMEYEFKGKERDWEIPEPYKSVWAKIKYGKKEKSDESFARMILNERRDTGTVTGRVTHKGVRRGDKLEHPNIEERPKRERTPRPSKDGLVTIAAICDELKIDPRDARKVLRSKKLEKPDAGWAWPANETDAIKKIIKAGVK